MMLQYVLIVLQHVLIVLQHWKIAAASETFLIYIHWIPEPKRK